MFRKISRLFMDWFGEPPKPFAEDDYRVAATALLIQLAYSDGDFDDPERSYLRRVARESFGLDEKTAQALIQEAEESVEKSDDFYQYTDILKRSLDKDGRLIVIELMWRLAYADGEEHEIEENLIWRVAELLEISSQDRLALRRRVRGDDA